MAKTVVGLFQDFHNAEQVIRELQDNGFRRDDISFMAPDRSTSVTDSGPQGQDETRTTETGKSAAAGAGTGAVLGGIAGLLVGLGALAIPGIGPIVAAGPIASALAGAGFGAVAGGVVGALVGAGVPEEEAHAYAEGVRRGGTLVMVRTEDNMANRASDIMNRYHPTDIQQQSAQWRQSGNWTGFDEKAEPYRDTHYDREQAGRTTASTTGGSFAGTSGAGMSDRETTGYSRTTGEDYTGTTGSGFGQGTTSTGRDRGYSSMRRDFNEYASDFRSDYNTSFGSRGRDYSYYEPAYRYGYDLAGNETYQGRQWDDVEPLARRDWERTHPGSAWDDVKDAVRHAWERVTSR